MSNNQQTTPPQQQPSSSSSSSSNQRPNNIFVQNVKEQGLGLGALNLNTSSAPSSPSNHNSSFMNRSQSYNQIASTSTPTTTSPLRDDHHRASTNSLSNSIDFGSSPLHLPTAQSSSTSSLMSSASIIQPHHPQGGNNNNNPELPYVYSSSNVQGLTGDEATLKRLIRVGNWNNVFKVADMCIAGTNNPLLILQYKQCRIVAHVRMRNYKIAYDEIQGIGDVRDLVNCYEAYPALFPNKKGTMVPFSMRVIKAELACHLGLEKYQLDALYALLSTCKREILNLEQQEFNRQNNGFGGGNSMMGSSLDQQQIFLSQVDAATTSLLTPTTTSPITGQTPSSSPPTSSQLHLSVHVDELFENQDQTNTNGLITWRLRERRIVFSIVTFIIQKNKDYLLAVKIIEDLIQRQQADQWTLSALGRIHLQMGNVSQAETIFKVTDRLIPEPEISVLSHMNKGFLAIALDQYGAAIGHFDKVIQLDPTNIPASNNKCIAMLYTCDLSGAVHALEQLMNKEKEKTIDETLIFNICSLYELSSEKSNEKKKAIMGDIARRAPDNFDFKVFKITNTQN
ncbi:hypothetical protein DFA_06145 [Cavenderia fasciculata]|uniref:Tetratricopeptide-like helical domain-containing protein n=1 Tax=Cavenderia fasciculata TaxID=261658 RepID=F4PK83_CACFS|nr:uncharacterized protein DFA_06145 [Cavenderia fasciculata]EGG24007.1 hypothetical protein DFA_06145 [Cavenderia fasciculata]|eukprot:XP_004361858.1 hypothetical protein DFA_06145 [Cavenderia fasciculata]